MDEAVSSCANPLSYKPSALKFTVSLLCRHPDHMTDLSIQPHPAKLIHSKYVHCTLMKELEPLPLDTEKEGHWFTGHKGMLCLVCYVWFVFLITDQTSACQIQLVEVPLVSDTHGMNIFTLNT